MKFVLKFIMAMIPTIVSIVLLVRYFPYTGLGRIVSIPATIFLNALIIVMVLMSTRRLQHRLTKTMVWILVITGTVLISIGLHPQDDLSSVFSQLWEKI